jgi:hypothetical protein
MSGLLVAVLDRDSAERVEPTDKTDTLVWVLNTRFEVCSYPSPPLACKVYNLSSPLPVACKHAALPPGLASDSRQPLFKGEFQT